jgi:hypothetical protein
VQLAGDTPSHILVPAIHYNRTEIRDIFRDEMPGAPADLSNDPATLAGTARTYLRRRFLSARVAVSGANFAIADSGTLVVVESEGNGRMCLTLPDVLISVVGVEKLLPTFTDLEVFMQLLPRSSTGERMNPYTSMWTGVTPGDGPREVTSATGQRPVTRLADPVGRQALAHRCSAFELPGLRAHRRPRLRVVIRPDRRDPDPAVPPDAMSRALRLTRVRRLLRRVPGEDQYPRGTDPSPADRPAPAHRAGRDAHTGRRDVPAPSLSGGAAGGPRRRQPREARCAPTRAPPAAVAGLAMDGDPRCAAAGHGDVRRMVGP